MEKEHKGGGFLAGLVIGAAVGALVSTKRGRQILKDLSEYGLDYVGRAINLEDIDTFLLLQKNGSKNSRGNII